MLYVLKYVPGPNWQPEKPVTEQPLEDHLAYMARQFERGALLMGGPLMDHSGGLIILHVADLQEAQQIMAADPAVTSGIVAGSAHPWMPLMKRTCFCDAPPGSPS